MTTALEREFPTAVVTVRDTDGRWWPVAVIAGSPIRPISLARLVVRRVLEGALPDAGADRSVYLRDVFPEGRIVDAVELVSVPPTIIARAM